MRRQIISRLVGRSSTKVKVFHFFWKLDLMGTWCWEDKLHRYKVYRNASQPTNQPDLLIMLNKIEIEEESGYFFPPFEIQVGKKCDFRIRIAESLLFVHISRSHFHKTFNSFVFSHIVFAFSSHLRIFFADCINNWISKHYLFKRIFDLQVWV